MNRLLSSPRRRLAAALVSLALGGANAVSATLYIVTTTADSGAGSLRQAILDANADNSAAVHSIVFSIAGSGPHTISPASALPTITRGAAITGFIESISGVPGILLDGSAIATANVDGLSFSASADGSSVAYLAILNFTGDGIQIASDTTSVSNCYIGISTNGTSPGGNDGNGILVSGASATIGSSSDTRNIISGNSGNGVSLTSTAGFSVVRGNRIGTNAAGTAALPNGGDGVGFSASGVTVGGNAAGEGNLISGNGGAGVKINSASAISAVQGNTIGLDAAGAAAVPNVGGGVWITGDNALVGSTDAAGRNVIAGNGSLGIMMFTGADGTEVRGNYIGTNAAGDAAVAGQTYGIRVTGTVTNCTIGGDGATYRNVISGASNWGISIESAVSGCTVSGNYIGLNAAGTGAVPNATGVDIESTNNVVGGSSAGTRNVISGNTNYGVVMGGSSVKIQGNRIGTNPAGTAAIANGRGIRVIGASGGSIGGTAAGEGNLVSGNTNGGIDLDGNTSNVLVAGNIVGLNASGNAAVANGGGIGVRGSGHTIGGSTAAARNVVSGNPGGGFYVTGSGHVIAGNYVGTTADGSAAIGNGSYGLRADTIDNVTIGGATAAAGNVFAGNTRGVNLGYGSHDNQILNNVIGLNAAMTVDLPDSGTGIEIDDSWDNQIGLPGKGNVIAGMSYQGIGFQGDDATGNQVQGNWIGTNKAGATTLGNDFAGIFIADSSGNLIGGTGAGEGNVIAHNYQFGVRVDRGEMNEISGNSIFGNFFGIDLDELGFFPNDAGDGDVGGNQVQNYPLLASALVDGGATDVEGLLVSAPDTEYRIEFFSGPTCGNAGFGEGRNFRGSTQVTTDGSGQAAIAHALPLAVPDAYLTATATDPDGNTSEFSPCAQVNLAANPGTFQFDRFAYVGYEGVIPTTKVFVTRSLGLTGTATVEFTTSNLTATAGTDYTDSDQTLTFQPWEVVKIVEVPILYDPAPEPFEKLNLALASPSAGASLGSPAAGEIQIYDYTPADPGITVDDATIVEGDSGQSLMVFEVHLSPTDHQVQVTFLTEPATAKPGEDYVELEDIITFPASGAPQTIEVEIPILGDTDVEPDEYFWLRITSAPNGGNWIAYDTYGRGAIEDDDGGEPSSTIFVDDFELGNMTKWTAAVP